jgi:hypothetical protein
MGDNLVVWTLVAAALSAVFAFWTWNRVGGREVARVKLMGRAGSSGNGRIPATKTAADRLRFPMHRVRVMTIAAVIHTEPRTEMHPRQFSIRILEGFGRESILEREILPPISLEDMRLIRPHAIVETETRSDGGQDWRFSWGLEFEVRGPIAIVWNNVSQHSVEWEGSITWIGHATWLQSLRERVKLFWATRRRRHPEGDARTS